MGDKFVCYYRLSVKKKAERQHGISAQKEAVRKYVKSVKGKVVSEHTEYETATGKKHRRVLQKALEECQATGATLCISKIDRLTRSVAFLEKLKASGVPFVATDNPHLDEFTIGILCLVAEQEAKTIQKRIKEGLAAAKRAGIVLGAPEKARQKGTERGIKTNKREADAFTKETIKKIIFIEKKSRRRKTLQDLADILNREGIRTRRGNNWFPMSVRNVKKRAEGLGLY